MVPGSLLSTLATPSPSWRSWLGAVGDDYMRNQCKPIVSSGENCEGSIEIDDDDPDHDDGIRPGVLKDRFEGSILLKNHS